ncbi:hypothetical protein ACN9M1_17900 [Ralstonia sp. R-29]|uniref:hypothetical protein n=1 Tax=Ralstonia sp. R-29 TaxID=3404059 RepID=UPI003CE88AD3
MRAFTARFFAVVALGTAAVFTPVLTPYLSEPPIPMPSQLALGLPFLAAACAYGWTWLLHPRRADLKAYGPLRGALVALLTYLTFTVVLWISGYRGALFLIMSFVWTPFPYLAMAAGAIAGEANLHNTRARSDALGATLRLAGSTGLAILEATHARLRSAYTRLEQQAAEPRADAAITTIVSTCLLTAGGALGLAWLHPQSALSDTGLDMSLRWLPGTVALALSILGWTLGRVLLATTPATCRLRIALTAAAAAGFAAVQFWFNVAR